MSDTVIAHRSLPRLVFFAERTIPRETALDRALLSVQARFVTPFARLRARHLGRIVAVADSHAEALRSLDDEALRTRAREIRFALRRHETPRLKTVGLCFAIIREAAGRVLGHRHFDVQLIGGHALLRGMIAEMGTGEGKTLTVTLAAITAAFSGLPVHVVTVNDYLAVRDVESLGPLYAFFGLSVGSVTEGLKPDQRRTAYACDVTYCTNKELAFDYLRDILALGSRRGHLRFKAETLSDEDRAVSGVVLRGLHFAIVDEADSVLVDEARTPLILSQSAAGDDQARIFKQALDVADKLGKRQDYLTWDSDSSITLTPDAIDRLGELGTSLGGVWKHKVYREELVTQALTALHLMRRDEHYIVRDGTVQIVDEYTGRVMADRFWTDGLHQMIELKEGCAMSGTRVTLARMTYQKFFRRYRRLSGLSGTAREIGAELWSVYRLAIAQIPPNRPSKRRMVAAVVAPNIKTKWQLIAAEAGALSARGVPVLIGTRSVATSNIASSHLAAVGLDHVVLNASQDIMEAEIIGNAGTAGRITIATNMAGRGTDIRLADDARANGGLHVIMTEIHDSKRIDRQLAGRCARQGDPGAFMPILSLHDPLLDALSPTAKAAVAIGHRLLGDGIGRWIMRREQRRFERLHAGMRSSLLKSDEMLDQALAFSGNPE
ncbi:preprotein translocase subunit SecA [Tardiphaga sp.]|uniref:preprotein translocase subunit SecA n=1 Tax=Tardiphaga sp. TaxID=1926292 RepID=UPI0025FA886D|nr:preprotein translocase subunit SecA [Tardiphaga sp.]